jgi:fructose-specific phosphotransferase system IIA component
MAMPLRANTKWGAIEELVALLVRQGRAVSQADLLAAVHEREELVSTGLGFGIAIPHAISHTVLIPSIAVGCTEPGIDFAAIDGEPVRLIFLLAIPQGFGDRAYLQTLSRLARLLVHADFRARLLDAGTPEEFLQVFREWGRSNEASAPITTAAEQEVVK